MGKIILQTQNISIGYPVKKESILVAEKVNIQLKKGTLTALVGPNGIGKSTLLKTITRIIPPISGVIELHNKSLENYDNKTLAKEMSLVLTDKLPPSNLTIYEIIALGRQPYTNWLGTLTKEDEQKINEAIQLTNLQDLVHKKHDEVSDGQLQIALIARALAQDTDIIILDEPTTHLDLVHKATLLKLLQKLAHETQKSILYSTHDIDLAIQLVDEMIVFTSNGIVQNTPCNLIEENVFDALFINENITFNKTIGKFILK